MSRVVVKPYGEAKVDVIVPNNDDLRINTRIYGDTESIVFETTDHEGNELGDTFELTWSEILDAVQKWSQK